MIESDVSTPADNDAGGVDTVGGSPLWARVLIFTAAALTLLLFDATVGLLIGRSESAPDNVADTTPSKVDIGFAQDMSVHHRQAVEIGDLARDRGKSADVRQLGYDIATTQLGQIGRMQGWLTLWGAPGQAPGELMTWMSDGDHGGMTKHGRLAGRRDAGQRGAKPLAATVRHGSHVCGSGSYVLLTA